MRSRYSLAAQTRASEVPVLPPVYSTMVSPRFSRPSCSARAITVRAMRSLRLPVGFSHSSLTKMAAPPRGATLRSRTIEVFPIASRMSMSATPFARKLAEDAGRRRYGIRTALGERIG